MFVSWKDCLLQQQLQGYFTWKMSVPFRPGMLWFLNSLSIVLLPPSHLIDRSKTCGHKTFPESLVCCFASHNCLILCQKVSESRMQGFIYLFIKLKPSSLLFSCQNGSSKESSWKAESKSHSVYINRAPMRLIMLHASLHHNDSHGKLT